MWPLISHPAPSGLQVYGSPRSYPGGHKGSDYGVGTGTAVLAISNGVITQSNYNSVEGNFVTVLHDNGIKTHSIHLSSRSVTQGQRVSAGDQLGLSGNTGSASQGPHLHIEVYLDGTNRTDPHAFFLAYVGPGSDNDNDNDSPEEDNIKLITIFADKTAAEGNDPLFASTAVITESKGFVPTSTGRGSRLELQAWIAIANELGIPVEEKHVNVQGYQLAQRF